MVSNLLAGYHVDQFMRRTLSGSNEKTCEDHEFLFASFQICVRHLSSNSSERAWSSLRFWTIIERARRSQRENLAWHMRRHIVNYLQYTIYYSYVTLGRSSCQVLVVGFRSRLGSRHELSGFLGLGDSTSAKLMKNLGVEPWIDLDWFDHRYGCWWNLGLAARNMDLASEDDLCGIHVLVCANGARRAYDAQCGYKPGDSGIGRTLLL